MPLSVRLDLRTYIERLGGPTIGYSNWRLFVMTRRIFLNVSAERFWAKRFVQFEDAYFVHHVITVLVFRETLFI